MSHFSSTGASKNTCPHPTATAVIAGPGADKTLLAGRNYVIVENPALAYVEVAGLFEAARRFRNGRERLILRLGRRRWSPRKPQFFPMSMWRPGP